jgi:hypothetical protein
MRKRLRQLAIQCGKIRTAWGISAHLRHDHGIDGLT